MNSGEKSLGKPPSGKIAAAPKQRRRHPAFGAMKDVTWIAPGVDLTEPAMPEWADMIDEKYGKEQ